MLGVGKSGLGENPVSVVRKATLEVDVGDDQVVNKEFQVIESPEEIIILGRLSAEILGNRIRVVEFQN